MNIGIFTMAFNDWPLEKTLEYVSKLGYEAVEINAWKTYAPGIGYEPMESHHINLKEILGGMATNYKRTVEKYGLTISALTDQMSGWYALSPDEKTAKEARNRIKELVDAAAALDVPSIVSFSGAPEWAWFGFPFEHKIIWERQWKNFEEVWGNLLDYFAGNAIKLAVEAHPGSLVYNTETIERAIKTLGGRREFGLNYDPSHFVWQQIDPVIPIYEFRERIYHVHAKDTEINEHWVKKYGVCPSGAMSQGAERRGWTFRVPGWGNINWERFVTALLQIGYKGVLSFECEDPIMSREDACKQCLRLLKPLLVDTCAEPSI